MCCERKRTAENVAFDNLRSCLHVKKTRNWGGLERPLDTTRSNSASTSTKSPRLSNTSWIPVIHPFAFISSSSSGPFQDQGRSGSGSKLGACGVKAAEEDGEDFVEQD